MSLQKINTRTIVLILMILAATAMRFVSYKFPLMSNFTPVGAIALFGGAYFNDKWKAYLVPSKWVLMYSGSIYMYICFAIMVLIGTFIKKINIVNVTLASFAGVLVHWLIMDMPWLYGTLYPHTLAGYGASLVAAIPFEKNMILGDILFGAILFGGFELAKSKYTVLQTKRQLAL
jgi:hypothetical protein